MCSRMGHRVCVCVCVCVEGGRGGSCNSLHVALYPWHPNNYHSVMGPSKPLSCNTPQGRGPLHGPIWGMCLLRIQCTYNSWVQGT